MSLRLAVDGREWVEGVRTGIGRYLETALRGLAEVRPEWDCRVLLGPSGEERLVLPGLSYLRLPAGPTPWVDQVVLPRHLRAIAPDVFFSPYVKMPWRAPCPAAVTIHDLFPLTLPPEEGGLAWPGRLRLRLYTALSLARARAVITVSEASAREIQELFDPDPARLHVIPEGVDPLFFGEGSTEEDGWRGRMGLEASYLAAVSNFQPHKNTGLLLEAWSRAAEETGDSLLVLAGEGPRREMLMRTIEGRPGADRVRWTGLLEEDDLPVLYRNARALLQPSFAEGFGLPVAEAMACGTPVVVSDRGSLPEVVDEAGVILSPHQADAWSRAMVRMLKDEDYRERYAAAASSRAERFHPRRTAEGLAGLLERIARGSA